MKDDLLRVEGESVDEDDQVLAAAVWQNPHVPLGAGNPEIQV